MKRPRPEAIDVGRGQLCIVPREGLEPSRACAQRFLRPSCLPFHHPGQGFRWSSIGNDVRQRQAATKTRSSSMTREGKRVDNFVASALQIAGQTVPGIRQAYRLVPPPHRAGSRRTTSYGQHPSPITPYRRRATADAAAVMPGSALPLRGSSASPKAPGSGRPHRAAAIVPSARRAISP